MICHVLNSETAAENEDRNFINLAERLETRLTQEGGHSGGSPGSPDYAPPPGAGATRCQNTCSPALVMPEICCGANPVTWTRTA